MRYSPAHAAKSGSVPFMLRGPKPVRTILSAAVAGVIGIVPGVMIASPAAAVIADYTFQANTASANEGSPITFTVVRAGAATIAAESLTWTVTPSGGATAAEPEDYAPATGALTFPIGDGSTAQNQPIVINTTDDAIDEENETFTVTVYVDGTPGDTITATGTINDNDTAPTYELELDDASPGEAAGSVDVTAKLLTESERTVNIPLSSADGTAKAGQDYTAIAGGAQLTVLPGATVSDTVSVSITDDLLYEESEQIFTITGAADATVSGTDSATVTISDNEFVPQVTINPTSADEGDPLQFDVMLSGPSERQVTVSAGTADGSGSDLDPTVAADHGTAEAGEDYTAVSNSTITFPAAAVNNPPTASTEQVFTVTTTADTIDEVDPEDMHVTISNATIADLGTDVVATGAINDDDDSPTVSLLPSTRRVPEGNAGKVAQTFTVNLSKASAKTVAVKYDVTGDTAADGLDFSATTGTLTFAPGETSKTFTVDIIGDTIYEGTELFDLDLSSSTANVPGSLGPVSIQITDDDAKPTVTFGSLTMAEGNGGSVAVLPITLSNSASTNVSFTVDDIPGIGLGGATTTNSVSPWPGELDYIPPSTTAFVPAGQTTGYVYFLVNGDDVLEPTETMQVELTPVGANVALGVKTATLTITNDDAAPSIEVISAIANEGDKVQVRAKTSGGAQEESLYTVTFRGASVNGSVAASADDFVDPGTILVKVPAGTPSGATVDVGTTLVQIVDDTLSEGPETILASGNAFGSGKVIDGVITITASDGGSETPATKPTLMASTSTRLGAGTVTLTGTAGDGAAVELWGRTVNAGGDESYAKISDTVAASNGAFSFTPGLSTDGMFFKVASNGMESAAVRVLIRQDPDLVATSTSSGVVRLTVTGDPKIRGLGARVFRANANGTWTMVGSGILNASGTFTRVLLNQGSGRYLTFRAYVVGDGPRGVLTNYSSYTRSVRVR